MIDQSQFRKKLEELLEQADVQDKRLTNEQIKEFFAEDGLTEEQMLLVYDFLMSQKIVVSGYYKQQTTEQIDESKFSDEEIDNAKKYMTSGIKTVQDEQDSEITYYMGQELSKTLLTFEEYMDKINSVTREEILEIAKNIHINTIYFLMNENN